MIPSRKTPRDLSPQAESRNSRQRVRERRVPERREDLLNLPPDIRNHIIGYLPSLMDQMQLLSVSRGVRRQLQDEMHSKGTFTYDDLVVPSHMRALGVDMRWVSARVFMSQTWGLDTDKFNTLETVEGLNVDGGPNVVALPPNLKQLSLVVRHHSNLDKLAPPPTVVALEAKCDVILPQSAAHLLAIVETLGRRFPSLQTLRLEYALNATERQAAARFGEIPVVDFKDVFVSHFPQLQTLTLITHGEETALSRLVLPDGIRTCSVECAARHSVELQRKCKHAACGASRLHTVHSRGKVILNGLFSSLKAVDVAMLLVNQAQPSIVELSVSCKDGFEPNPLSCPRLENLTLWSPAGSLDYLQDFKHLSQLQINSGTEVSFGAPLQSLTSLVLARTNGAAWHTESFPKLDVLAVDVLGLDDAMKVPRTVTKAFWTLTSRQYPFQDSSMFEDVMGTLQTLWLIGAVPLYLPPFQNLTRLHVFPSANMTLYRLPTSVTHLVCNERLRLDRQPASLQIKIEPQVSPNESLRSFVTLFVTLFVKHQSAANLEWRSNSDRRLDLGVSQSF